MAPSTDSPRADQRAARVALSVRGDPSDDLEARLDRFGELCRDRRGIRVARKESSFVVSVDPARIEAVGPVIEAGAIATGLRVVLDDLDAEVRSFGLDGRQSGVWAAIGNALDEDDVIRSRGGVVDGDPYRYVRVDVADGVRTLVVGRPPLLEPRGGPPMETGPEKFDDVGWHMDAAEAADQPDEYAFTHIGIYLAWLIRHDLHDRRWFPRDHVREVKAGSMTGSDIADDIDGKLISDEMSAEGAEFSSARYARYVTAYGELVGDDVVYRVPETQALYDQVEPMIDAMYADWVAAGRPGPELGETSAVEAEFEAAFDAAAIPWEEIGRDADGPVEVHLGLHGSYEVIRPERPHEDPELEALIPADLVDPPLVMESVTASHWGSSLLNRALRQLGVRPRDATVSVGMGGRGNRVLTVSVYRVPGASRADLHAAFSSVIWQPRGSSWSDWSIGGTTVSWAEGPVDGAIWNMAYWTRDGLVFHVSGDADDMAAAITGIG